MLSVFNRFLNFSVKTLMTKHVSNQFTSNTSLLWCQRKTFFQSGEDKSKQTLLKPRTWVADKLLKVTEDLRLTEGRLEDFPLEKRVCLRKLQRDKELNTTSGKRNLYAILGLDMDQIRHTPREKQKEAIKKGFREQIERWHPDKNFGDEDNAKEIIVAQKVLLDDEMRARYHNEADYHKG